MYKSQIQSKKSHTTCEELGSLSNRSCLRDKLLALLAVYALAIGILILPQPTHAQADEQPLLISRKDTATCLGCHADRVDMAKFTPSAHGTLYCQDCHKAITQFPHPPKAIGHKPVCASCHSGKRQALTASVHAHAAIRCQSCHGNNAHAIAKISTQPARQQATVCARCHQANATAVSRSIHGSRATCFSCHGRDPHGIRPPVKLGTPRQNAVCLACHDAAVGNGSTSVHAVPLRGKERRMGCLACHGGNPHAIGKPAVESAAQLSARCAACHPDNARRLAASAHGGAGKFGEMRPNCTSCHREKFHAVPPPARLTPQEKVTACRRCHAREAKDLAAGVHTHANPNTGTPAPDCLTCHGDGDPHAVALPAKQSQLQRNAACHRCHTPEAKTLRTSVHAHADLKTGKAAPECLACHGASNPHAIASPATLTHRQKEAPCESCHRDLSPTLMQSVHNRPDKVPGDHPTCNTCHGPNPHGIAPPKRLTPKEQVELCARCHADAQRMARYGRVDAVASYAQTFHGRAIMLFGQTREATCVDCHGIHGVLAPENPAAPTNPRHVSEICHKCHAQPMYFAYSYASHLRLNVEHSVVTPLAQWTFHLLALGPYILSGCLLLLAALRFAYRQRPRLLASLLSAYDFLCLLTALFAVTAWLAYQAMLHFGEQPMGWPGNAVFVLLLLSVVALAARRLIFPRRVLPPQRQIEAE